MSFLLKNAYMNQDANPEKIKVAEIQFEAMNVTFNNILSTCAKKCIPDEYGEADLNKGEMVCLDRCVAKFYKANIKIGESIMSTAATKTKTARKKKDPNAPKRSLSAYMFFANDRRDSVRAENPGISFGSVGKVLGEQWKALTPEEKQPYEQKAEADKKRYEEEKATYAASLAE